MEDYIGKICPFCKTEIKEGDSVKVCPACGIPHHESCWEENHGCTTFGCSEQHYEEQHTNPTDVCQNCGTPLGDGQEFCPKCGTPKNEPKKNVCGKCGAELQEGQEFCPKCGQKVGLAVEADVNSAINQFNSGVEKKNKKNKSLPIIIAVSVIVIAALGVFISNALGAKKGEEARNEYIANVEEFLSLSLTAGSNLEDIADTVQKYWYENIWEDKHGSDINSAILYALIDKSDEITEAENYDSQMKTLYSQIKKVPDGISDENSDEIREICAAVKDLYNVYTDFYSLATDPSGNYNSYSESNNDTTDEFLSCYRALENLLD